MESSIYALIMAGGEGTRFAPVSTPEKPKQFLSFFENEGSFLQQTFSRILPLVSLKQIWVATNQRYLPLVREQLPQLPPANILSEPLKKNTAPCLAYAAAKIAKQNREALMVVLPSDHIILDTVAFLETVKQGINLARKEKGFVTLGIQPKEPSTEYGYIQKLKRNSKAERFAEKPDEEKAKQYLKEGNFFWNSGIFIWQVSVFLEELKAKAPSIFSLLGKENFWEKVEAISVDYALFEKSDRVHVIPANFGWYDAGTWQGLQRLAKKGILLRPEMKKSLAIR